MSGFFCVKISHCLTNDQLLKALLHKFRRLSPSFFGMIPAYIKVLELKRRELMKTLLVLLSLTVFAPLSFGMSMEKSEEITTGQKLHQTGGEICASDLANSSSEAEQVLSKGTNATSR